MWHKIKRIMMRVNNTTRLPIEYQEVEYIQSTGTQSLAIWNSFSTDYKVEIDLQLTYTWGDQILFWCVTNSLKFWINAYSSNFKTTTGGMSWSDTKSEDANRHTFIMDKGTTYVDWTSYSSSYVSGTFNFWLWLFEYNRAESSSRFPAEMKLFSCKIYNWSTILYDLVPCYRKNDSVIWMYDIVNDVFYTNSWTWTFTKWNDVPDMVEKQIRPTPVIEFATQWPSPSWFHVPLYSEWTALKDAGTTLWAWNSSWADNFKTYLKLPFAGYRRNNSSAEIANQDVYWDYWTSVADGNNNGCSLEFRSWSINTLSNDNRTYWFSVRSFKNEPVVPDSSWTVLYQWSWSAWIYHNSSLWLISISSDGSNWITIMDKNLWATTVYNSGDTLSEANCWNYFQRWNNYGFPFTWSVTVSTSTVDASTYWPWNYYSSSTFISYSWSWDSSNNKNLRWWEDGNVPIN